MKKFIFFSLIAVMVAGMAFAQTANGISVNAWGRGVFSPLVLVGPNKTLGDVWKDASGDDEEASVYAGTGITWGGPKVRTDFRINGNSDYVGFVIQLNGEDPAAGDQQFLWVKPLGNEAVKLSAGQFIVDDLRGKINTDTGFENFVLYAQNGDAIFNRFGSGSDSNASTNGGAVHGFMLSSAPIDGLFIGLLVNGDLWNWGGPGTGMKARDLYRYVQIGAGYDLSGIGHIRAQYIGGWLGTVGDNDDRIKGYDFDEGKRARMEAAFALTAIDNLLIDFGMKFYMPLQVNIGGGRKYYDGVDLGLGAQYNMGAFGITGTMALTGIGAVEAGRGDNSDATQGLNFAVTLIPTYSLDAVTLGLDLSMQVNNMLKKDKDGKTWKDHECDRSFSPVTTKLGVGGFARMGFGSGSLKAGVAYTFPTIDTVIKHGDNDGKGRPSGQPGGKNGEVKTGFVGHGVLSVPIILEYAFF